MLRTEIFSIALRRDLWYRVSDRLLLQGLQSGEGANHANADSGESYESHLFNGK